MKHVRERRTHALVTAPGCQVDGVVDVREFAFDGGTRMRFGMHRPAAIVVRDARGERTVSVPADRPDYAKWALPVAAFAIIRIISHRRSGRSTRHDER